MSGMNFSELEQSYFLPTSAVNSSVVLRNSLLASNWTGEAKVSQRRRVEVVHDALRSERGFSLSSSLCQPCAIETVDKLGKRTTELANDARQYKTALGELHQRKQKPAGMSLEQIQQEIFLLTKEISTFDESNLMSYVQGTSLRNEIAKSKISINETESELRKVDFDSSMLDNEILSTLELLDCTAKEINVLKGLPVDVHVESMKNRVAPLFDAIDCTSPADTESSATINRCRLSYAANSHINLNYSEINTAYANLSVLVSCLRNACDLPSINLIGVAVGSSSPYFSLAYKLLLHQHLIRKFGKESSMPLCTRRFCRLLSLVESTSKPPTLTPGTKNNLILQLRPLQSRVLLRLLSPTGPTSATENWLHLEAGVMTSFHRQTYAFKTSSKRNHKKVDWQGSGSCNSGGSGGGGGSGDGSGNSGSHGNGGAAAAAAAAAAAPQSSFFNTLLVQSVFFQSPVSSPAPKQRPSSPMPPAAQQMGAAEEDQEAVVVESDQDDPVYRRAVLGLAACVVVTSVDLLLARQGVTQSQLLSMSTVDSFRLLWSVISTHLKGCMLEIACALMTGVPVGFEEAMECHGTLPGTEEFEVVESGVRGVASVLEHSVVTKLLPSEKPKISRQESLFDMVHTRVSEMHQLVMDMVVTLKHVCSLE